MSSDDQPPRWLNAFMAAQTASFSAMLAQHLPQPLALASGSGTQKNHGPGGTVPSKKSRPPMEESDADDEDDLDDFDRRFGHLIGPNVNNTPDDSDAQEVIGFDNASSRDMDENNNSIVTDDADDAVSVDDDLVDVSDRVVNWDISSSMGSFLSSCADKPLPADALKQLDKDYTPKESFQEYFSPPKMPKRLFKMLSRMKSKGASKTEASLYNAQKELFTVAKPLVSALSALKPLGKSVSKERGDISLGLRGLYSSSLGISNARRENVRFLFKKNLAEVIYDTPPNHSSLFGGTSFASQLDKATKESKLDFTFSKPRRPFLDQQGFYGRGGRNNYVDRRSNNRQNRFNNNGYYDNRPNNYNNSNSNPKRGGYGGNKSARGKSKGSSSQN